MAASAPKVVLSLLKNEESILSNYFPIPYQQMATIAILHGSMLKTAQNQWVLKLQNLWSSIIPACVLSHPKPKRVQSVRKEPLRARM